MFKIYSIRSHGSCTLPPFVEFDMSAEGFGCLYLPSVAPQSANINTLGSQDNSTTGGIGSGNFQFPITHLFFRYIL